MAEPHRRKRVAVREPFCPLGCKTHTGATYRVGLGSCDSCVEFNGSTVAQQAITLAQLIAKEDELNSKSSLRLIPAGPPSPNGKKGKDSELIADAQKLIVNMEHQQKSGYGASATAEGVDDIDHETAGELKKRKIMEAKAIERKEAGEKKKKFASEAAKEAEARQFDIQDHQPQLPAESLKGSNVASHSNSSSLLTKVLEVGQGIVIHNIPHSGRGLVSTVLIRKSQHICYYDGNRVDATTGQILMICKRTRDAILTLPQNIQTQLRALQYSKTWAVTLNRGTNIKLFGGTPRDVVIDGTIAASPIIDHLVNRGLIGPGSLMNSSQKTGIPPNCCLIFIPWHENSYSLANYFVPTMSEKMMAVLVAKFDIPANTHLTWNYSIASHPVATVSPLLNAGLDLGTAPGVLSVPVVDGAPLARSHPVATVSPLLNAGLDLGTAPGVLSVPVVDGAPLARSHPVATVSPLLNAGLDLGTAPGVSGVPVVDGAPLARSPIVCSDCVDKPQQFETCAADNTRASDIEEYHDPVQLLTPVVPPTLLEERIREAGKLKSRELKVFVKQVMDVVPSIVPAEFRLTNVSNNFSFEFLQDWCVAQAQRMESARIKRFKTILSARDSVEACMRMLALFSNDQYMQNLYLNSRSLPTQTTMDAKAHGDDHPFWTELHHRFHSPDHVLPFPWDYIPSRIKVTNSHGIESEYAPPEAVDKGFLKGLDLMHARKPAMYSEFFFNKHKLQELWKKSLADYRWLHCA
jgi:hypothetical protein